MDQHVAPAGPVAQHNVRRRPDLLLVGEVHRRITGLVRAGRDEAFGRSADTLVPLDLGRLYAIATWPGIAADSRTKTLRPASWAAIAAAAPAGPYPAITTSATALLSAASPATLIL